MILRDKTNLPPSIETFAGPSLLITSCMSAENSAERGISGVTLWSNKKRHGVQPLSEPASVPYSKWKSPTCQIRFGLDRQSGVKHLVSSSRTNAFMSEKGGRQRTSATMASGQPAPLLFLNHLSTDSFRKERQLDTRAKAHASRQGHQLKSTQPKNFKFVSCFSGGGTGRGSGLTETKASTKPCGRPAKSKSTPKRSRPNDQDASQLMPRGISPRGIGVGVWDPFNSLIVPNLAQDEHFMLHYGMLLPFIKPLSNAIPCHAYPPIYTCITGTP